MCLLNRTRTAAVRASENLVPSAFCLAMVKSSTGKAGASSVRQRKQPHAQRKADCDKDEKPAPSSPSTEAKAAPSTSERKPTAWDLRVQKLRTTIVEELEEKMRSKYSKRLRGMRLRWRAKHVEMMQQLHHMENMMDNMASKLDGFVAKVEEEVFFAQGTKSSPGLSSSSTSDEAEREYNHFIQDVVHAGQDTDAVDTVDVPALDQEAEIAAANDVKIESE